MTKSDSHSTGNEYIKNADLSTKASFCAIASKQSIHRCFAILDLKMVLNVNVLYSTCLGLIMQNSVHARLISYNTMEITLGN